MTQNTQLFKTVSFQNGINVQRVMLLIALEKENLLSPLRERSHGWVKKLQDFYMSFFFKSCLVFKDEMIHF